MKHRMDEITYNMKDKAWIGEINLEYGEIKNRLPKVEFVSAIPICLYFQNP